MSKHTPGPWEVIETETGIETTICEGVRTTYRRTLNIPESERTENMRLMEEEANANARLIVAAPDLLAACIFVRDSLKRRLPKQGSFEGQIITALEAAIAKAESC